MGSVIRRLFASVWELDYLREMRLLFMNCQMVGWIRLLQTRQGQ